MNIQLSDHFTYSRLLRFVIPSIVMMIFTSIYSVVDGLFISNFVGKTPFAAVNLIMPFAMLLGGFGFMIGTGSSALVGKTLGEGDREKANQIFSLLIYVSIGLGAVLAVFGIVFIKPISVLLGADEQMLGYCVVYCRILMLALPGFMLQNVFQSFLITAEKPAMGLDGVWYSISVAEGAALIVTIYFFITKRKKYHYT
ncbi:MAG: MATE family efflux transporter [Anaerotignum sp.]